VFLSSHDLGLASRWRLIPVKDEAGAEEETYYIQLVGARGEGLAAGAYLYAFQDSDDDKRDATSTYLCVHDKERAMFTLRHTGEASGRPFGDHGAFPTGQLRDCSVFSRVLDSEEVQRLYRQEKCEQQ